MVGDVIVGGELFTDYSDHRKLVTLNPKLKSTGAGRYQLFLSRWWMLYRKQLGLKDFSPKSWRWHCSRLERGALPMIDRGDIRRKSTVAAISGLHSLALVMVSSSIRLTAWLAKFKEVRMVRADWCWAESPRLSPLWLSASSSACHGLLIKAVITPLPTKPSATKAENWSWRTRQLLTCRCVSVMLLRSMQRSKELADAKAENDALRDDVAAGRRRLHIKAVCQSVWSHHASGVDNAASPWLADTHNDYFTLRERLITGAKNNWKEPRSILMSSADRVAHIDGQLMQLLWAIHTRFQHMNGTKTEQSIYECLLGFCFINIFCAATNFGCNTVSSAQFQKRRNDGWWFPLCAIAAGLFWNSNVCLYIL